MAIVIPSKNIYGDPINAKIRDNIIDNISIEINKVLPDNQYEVAVINQNYYNFYDSVSQEIIDARSYLISNVGNGQHYRTAVAFTYVLPKYANFEIIIPVIEQNKWNKNLLDKTDKDGNPNIKCVLFGEHNQYNAMATAKSDDGEDKNIYYKGDISKTSVISEIEGFYELPSLEIENENTVFTVTAIANITVNDLSNIKEQEFKPVVIDEIEYYKTNITVISGLEIWKLKGDTTRIFDITENIRSFDVELNGTIEEFKPNKIEVTVYGNKIGISLNDKNVSYKYGNKPYTISGNELLQDGTKTYNKITSEYLATGVLNSYARGKETAKLLCAIGEYKDENGELVISAKNTEKPMSFNEGDIVIPKVFSANGEDVPMSRYKDGTSKQFEVVKVNFIYDGATYQELTLQEYTKGE